MTKTHTRIWPKIAVVAMAFVAFLYFTPIMTDYITDDSDAVTIVVDFLPVKRSGNAPPGRTLKDLITIQVTVAGQSSPKHQTNNSPWTLILHPRKGERIDVRAEQFYGDWLRCTITRDGQESSTQVKFGPTLVRCVLTVK